ncbi:hypothetical protein Btru_068389 [Bulinus truncatus]|nr:hypothetical protein Btru_068389 [Bulinus truncatus]
MCVFPADEPECRVLASLTQVPPHPSLTLPPLTSDERSVCLSSVCVPSMVYYSGLACRNILQTALNLSMAKPANMNYSIAQGTHPKPKVTFLVPREFLPGKFHCHIEKEDLQPGYERFVCLFKQGDDIKAKSTSNPFPTGVHKIAKYKCDQSECRVKFKTKDVPALHSVFPLD